MLGAQWGSFVSQLQQSRDVWHILCAHRKLWLSPTAAFSDVCFTGLFLSFVWFVVVGWLIGLVLLVSVYFPFGGKGGAVPPNSMLSSSAF